jgi:hypothetical protein
VPTGLPSNVLERAGNLRFDQAKRDSTGRDCLDISPVPITTLAFTFFHNKDQHKEIAHGVQESSYDTYTGEINLSPGEQWSASRTTRTRRTEATRSTTGPATSPRSTISPSC